MSKNSYVIVVVVLIVLGVIWYGVSGSKRDNLSMKAGEGRVVLAVKDATKDIANVTAINITVDKVEAHINVDGWVTVPTTTKQYDLLKLKQSGAAELLADVNLTAGAYDQLRLNISRVDVTAGGKTQEAKLPSHSLKITGNIVVIAGQTSTVTLDFLADKSLHLTGNGKYILSPVVKFESKSDSNVEIKDGDDRVVISGGKIEDDETEGMDADGRMKINFELNGNLEVDSKDRINLNGRVVMEMKGNDEEDNQNDQNNNNQQNGENDQSSLLLNFSAQSNSGLSGTAMLKQEDGKVKVDLRTSGGVLSLLSASLPAHVHLGSCANLGAVKFPLNAVVNGESETEVNTTLASLKANMPLAINIHKSTAEIGTYVACTDIKF